MTSAKDIPAYCMGFRNQNFEMSSNISSVFLKIKEVSLSDSGLYFCGFYTNGYPIFSEVHLNVEGKVILKYYLSFSTHYLVIYV